MLSFFQPPGRRGAISVTERVKMIAQIRALVNQVRLEIRRREEES